MCKIKNGSRVGLKLKMPEPITTAFFESYGSQTKHGIMAIEEDFLIIRA